MDKETYVIDLSGEDGGTVFVSLTKEEHELFRSTFDELNSQCKYTSIRIRPMKEMYKRFYCVNIRRGKNPLVSMQTVDIPNGLSVVSTRSKKYFLDMNDAMTYLDKMSKKITKK